MYRKPLNIIAEKHRLLPDSDKSFSAAYSIAGIKDEIKGYEYGRYIECKSANKPKTFVKIPFQYFIRFVPPNRKLKLNTLKIIITYLLLKKKTASQWYNVFCRTIETASVKEAKNKLKLHNKYQLADKE